MDTFINLAKQGIEQYSQSQNKEQGGGFNVQGGAQWNSPHHSNQGYQPEGGESFQPGMGHRIGPDVDADEAIKHASHHAEGAGGNELFSQAMSFLHSNSHQHEKPVDEEHVLNAHEQAYNRGNASGLDAASLGGAAAMQVLKKFTSGGGGGGGNSQTQLISMAMAEAAKLFDSAGGSGGNKQEAVNSAAMTVMKLVVQSKFNGSGVMGGGGGGGGLMGMVSKFL